MKSLIDGRRSTRYRRPWHHWNANDRVSVPLHLEISVITSR